MSRMRREAAALKCAGRAGFRRAEVAASARSGWAGAGWAGIGGSGDAGVFFLRERRTRPPSAPKQTGEVLPSLEDLSANRGQQTAGRTGGGRGSARGQGLTTSKRWRALYLEALASLHQAHLIHYERTRTNGEYVRQVHLAPAAHGAGSRIVR